MFNDDFLEWKEEVEEYVADKIGIDLNKFPNKKKKRYFEMFNENKSAEFVAELIVDEFYMSLT